MLSRDNFINHDAWDVYQSERSELINRITELKHPKIALESEASKRRNAMTIQRKINRKALELEDATEEMMLLRKSSRIAKTGAVVLGGVGGLGLWFFTLELPIVIPIMMLIVGLIGTIFCVVSIVLTGEDMLKRQKAVRLAQLEYNDAMLYNLD